MLTKSSPIRTVRGALGAPALLSVILALAPTALATSSPHSSPTTQPGGFAHVSHSSQLIAAGIPQLFEMVVDDAHSLLYGSDTAGGKIWMLSLPNLTTVATIDVGSASQPSGIDLTQDGTTLAVARSGSGNIALVDTATRMVTGTLFPMGTTGPIVPYDVRFGRTGRLYSVGNPGSSGFDFVHVFDTTSQTEVGRSNTIVRAAPRLAITGDGNSLFVMESAFSPQSLTRFNISTDTPTVSASAPFGSVQGTTVAIRPDSSQVYLSSGQVWSGDLQHQLGTIITGGSDVGYAPATDRVYFTFIGRLFGANGTSLSVLGYRLTSGTVAGSLRINGAGTGAFVSSNAGLDSISLTTPAAPQGVAAVAGISSATVSWSPPTDTGSGPITGYTIASSGGAQATAAANVTSAVITGLGAGQRTFTVTASNAFGQGSSSVASNVVTVLDGATYHPLTPARILDTRDGTGGVPVAPIGQGGVVNVQVGGRGGIPATGVSAVFLNVTVTDTTASSYLSVWPAGVARPTVSNLNWTPGVTVPNLVEVALGSGGQLSIFNFFGSVDVIFDVAGWVGDAFNSAGRDGMFNSLQPSRLLDTRNGLGPLGPGATLNLLVAGRGGVPPSGVSAVVLNATVTNPTAPSYLTVWPAGATRPLASNLNFVAGQTVPNRVVVKLGAGGMISIFNFLGSADMVVDIDGWLTDSTSSAGGSGLVATVPGRFFDTRGTTGPLPAGGILVLQVNPADPRPMTALVLNVTATDATAPSFLTVWPDGAPQPLASDLNFAAGQTVPNLTLAGLSSARAFDIFNLQGSVDVVVDAFGFYGGVAPAPPAATVTVRSVGEAKPATAERPFIANASAVRGRSPASSQITPG
jgi:hypothetical protein